MKVYNVTRYRVLALILSAVLILGFWGYTLFVNGGFNFGIDFKAGLNITADVPAAGDEEAIRKALAEFSPQVQTAGEKDGRFIIRIADNDSVDNFQQTTSAKVSGILKKEFGSMTVVNEEYIGSGFAGSLATQTIWITLIALGLILLYIWVRFKLNYAVSAIAAVFHDVLFLLGFIGAFQLEFSTATIAAVLTIIGYSLNDTIVIFDRIRENSRIVKDKSFKDVVNISISQSLSRTLITSITTLLAVVAILVFAVGSIQTFALSLAVGVIVGTYSSLFIASPILLAWHERESAKVHKSMSGTSSSSHAPSSSPKVKAVNQPEPVKQTAEEIAQATEKRARAKAKKKKKKK
ncbi:MAG: protein translocase subunit SecF [Spirochaetales bacterium]|nr:MAG: protein translocase subunit SecF [Spirochaetales bacterium]